MLFKRELEKTYQGTLAREATAGQANDATKEVSDENIEGEDDDEDVSEEDPDENISEENPDEEVSEEDPDEDVSMKDGHEDAKEDDGGLNKELEQDLLREFDMGAAREAAAEKAGDAAEEADEDAEGEDDQLAQQAIAEQANDAAEQVDEDTAGEDDSLWREMVVDGAVRDMEVEGEVVDEQATARPVNDHAAPTTPDAQEQTSAAPQASQTMGHGVDFNATGEIGSQNGSGTNSGDGPNNDAASDDFASIANEYCRSMDFSVDMIDGQGATLATNPNPGHQDGSSLDTDAANSSDINHNAGLTNGRAPSVDTATTFANQDVGSLNLNSGVANFDGFIPQAANLDAGSTNGQGSINPALIFGNPNGSSFNTGGFNTGGFNTGGFNIGRFNTGDANLNGGTTTGQGPSVDTAMPANQDGSGINLSAVNLVAANLGAGTTNSQGSSIDTAATPETHIGSGFTFSTEPTSPGGSSIYSPSPRNAERAPVMLVPSRPSIGFEGHYGGGGDVSAGWESFKEERALVDTWKNRQPQSEREKYAPYLQQKLLDRNNETLRLFLASMRAGLRRLVFTPCQWSSSNSNERTLDGTLEMAAAIRTARKAHDGELFIPFCAADAFRQKVTGRARDLAEHLSTELNFDPVEYPKCRQLEGERGLDLVKGLFSIVKGQSIGIHGGHRGGDFVFIYKGTQTLAVNDRKRFTYKGQVPRTAGEYEYRLREILGRASTLTMSALKFKCHWSNLAQGVEPDVPGIFDNDNAARLWGAYRRYKEGHGEQFKATADRNTPLGNMLQDMLYEKDEICEFAWLVTKLRKLKWAPSAGVSAVEEMLTEMAGSMDGLKGEYEGRQQDIAWALLLDEEESGDRVLVCMNNIHKVSHPVSGRLARAPH